MKELSAYLFIAVLLTVLLIGSCAMKDNQAQRGILIEGVIYEKDQLKVQDGYSWRAELLITPKGDSIPTFVLVSDLRPDDVLAYQMCGCGGYPFGPNTCEPVGFGTEISCFGDCGAAANAPNCGSWLVTQMPLD